jgi:hypothetical protein
METRKRQGSSHMTGYAALGGVGLGLAGWQLSRGYKKVTQILRAPPTCEARRQLQPRFRPPITTKPGCIAPPSNAATAMIKEQ